MKKLPKLLVLSLLTIGLTSCNNTSNSSSNGTISSATSSSVESTSSSVAQKYSITTPSDPRVDVSVSKNEAEAGEKISFTVSSSNSYYYELGAVKVVSGNSTISTKVALKNGTPTYTFTMPAGDVSILVESITDYGYINVTTDAFTHVTFTVDDVEVVTDVDEKGVIYTDAIEVGKKVTMTLTFDDDRILDGQPTFSIDCGLTSVTDGVCYTFTMPGLDSEDNDLSITLTSKENEALFHSITSVKAISKYVDENSITGISESNSIKQDKLVNVSCKLTSRLSTKDNDKLELGISVNGNVSYLTVDETDDTLFTGSFVMPSVDTEIKFVPLTRRATQAEIEAGDYTTVTVENSDYVDFYGFVSGEKYPCYESENIAGYVFAYAKQRGDIIDSIKYKGEGSSYSYSASYSNNDEYYGVRTYMLNTTARGKSMTITVNASRTGVHTFSLDESNTDAVTLTSDATDYAYGENLVINVAAKTGYYVTGIDSIKGVSGTKYTTSNYTYADNKITFKSAPKEDITIKFKTAKKIEVTYSKVSGVSDIKFGVDTSDVEIDALVPGKKFLVHFTLDDATSTTITNVKVGGTSLSSDSTSTKGNVVSFCYWPSSSLTSSEPLVLTYELIHIHTITLDTSDKYTIVQTPYISSYSNKVSSAYKDSTISFDIKEVAGYKIDSVALSNGGDISHTSGTTKYSFKMPDEDVNIIVNTSQVNTHKVTVSKDSGITDLVIKDKYGNKLDPSTDLESINEGEELTLSFKVPNGFTLTTFKYGDDDITATPSESKGVKTYSNVKFTVNGTKELTFVTTESAKGTITISKGEFIDSVTVKNTTLGTTIAASDLATTNIYEGNEVQVSAKLNAAGTNNDAKTITKDSFVVKDASNNIIETTFSSSSIKFKMPSSSVTITVNGVDYPTVPVTFTDDAASYLDIYYGYTASGTPLTSVDSFKVGAKGYSFKLKEGVYDSTKVYTLSVVDQNGKSIKWSGSDTLTTSSTSYRPNNDTTSVTITLTITDKA